MNSYGRRRSRSRSRSRERRERNPGYAQRYPARDERRWGENDHDQRSATQWSSGNSQGKGQWNGGSWNDRRSWDNDNQYDQRGGNGGYQPHHRDHENVYGGDRIEPRHAPPEKKPRLDWICASCQGQNFARREKCYKCSSPKTDKCIEVGSSIAPTSKVWKSFEELESNSPTSCLLIRQLGSKATELEVADGFRVYAPVKSVKVVFDPRPGVSTHPAAVVEFHTLEASQHVLSMASSGLKIGGVFVEPSFAKSTAPVIALAWAAQAEASRAREVEYRDERGFTKEEGRYGRVDRGDGRGADSSGGHRYNRDYDRDSRYGSRDRSDHYSSQNQQGDRERRPDMDRSRPERSDVAFNRSVSIPKWPPSFEEDGAVWVFDPTSGYFLHRATEMFYEPKSKWYSKRDKDGKFVYYYHAAGYDPPFIPMPIAAPTTQTAAVDPSTAAVTTTSVTTSAVAATTTTTTTSTATVSSTEKPAQKEKKEKKNRLEIAPLKLSLKKTALDINKWNDRKLETEETSDDKAKKVGAGAGVLDKESELLMKLGLDYATLGCLRVIPPTDGETATPAAAGPICDGSGEKWACLLSRRCFSTEDQLAKHIRLSKLYKEELTKAITEGRIIRLA